MSVEEKLDSLSKSNNWSEFKAMAELYSSCHSEQHCVVEHRAHLKDVPSQRWDKK